MLVSFSVANYRSFGDEVTLNMVASNKLPDHCDHKIAIGTTGKHVVRSAVLYGNNAAGKSNLIRALAVAQRLITNQAERISPVEQFRFRQTPGSEPTTFEFRFLIDEIVFIYGFDILVDRIQAEWLCFVRGDDEPEIFTRDNKGETVINKSSKRHFPHDAETLEKLKSLPLRNDQLFLNRAIAIPETAQGPTLAAILKWFSTELVVLRADSRTSDILDRLHTDQAFKEFCSSFLSNVGTGISKLQIYEFEREMNDYERRISSRYPNRQQFVSGPGSRQNDMDVRPKADDPTRVIVRRLVADHPTPKDIYPLPFGEESDGTQAMLHLLPFLASPPHENRVVAIDELDRSLHPLTCWEFIRFFSESCKGTKKQLIVTTHEAHLLDQELLRRDEYWFVEKDEHQQTQLTSLLEFNIRKDLQLQKGYLQGRFGGIPIIGGMQALEELLECTQSEAPSAAQEKAP